jgi:hypothetical protein
MEAQAETTAAASQPSSKTAVGLLRSCMHRTGWRLTVKANEILGGKPGQSLSARAYVAELNKNARWGWSARFINGLFCDPFHCQRSYRHYVGKQPRS